MEAEAAQNIIVVDDSPHVRETRSSHVEL